MFEGRDRALSTTVLANSTPPLARVPGPHEARYIRTVTELLTRALHLLRRRLRLAQQRPNHLRQQVAPFPCPCPRPVPGSRSITTHHLERLGEGVERGADVVGHGDGVRSRAAGLIGADFREGREEGGEVGAAVARGRGGIGGVGGVVFDCWVGG